MATDVTAQCREISKLNKLTQTLLLLALKDIKSQGVEPLIVETYRSKARQFYLYCQGRTVEQVVNAGVPKATAVKYCNPSADRVTWTLNSIHILRNAVDVVPQRNGKAIWNTNDTQTQIIIKTMQKYGFEAGANWDSNVDSPHFQIKNVSETKEVYSSNNTNTYITRMIQSRLNEVHNAKIKVDGNWGSGTTKAVNDWRYCNGWKRSGGMGTTAVAKLMQ